MCPSGELYTNGEICERCVRGSTFNAVRYRCYRNSLVDSAWYSSIIGVHRTLNTFSRTINAFMVPDHFLRDKLTEGRFPKDKIWRNPNPFFASDFAPHYENDGYFLYVGRLVRQKGIFTLVEAARRMSNGARLLIVGRGEAEEEIENLIYEYHLTEKVFLLGPKWGEEVVELIRNSIAVIIPSEWYDNLPLILCQANACGKPVIASRINGIPEYVVEGENGLLFKPGNADELALAMGMVANIRGEAYEGLCRYSRKVAEEIFDYANHYKILMDIIKSISR